MTIDIRELAEPFYPAIGKAIVAWARLEIRADEQLISMLNHKASIGARQMLGIHVLDHIPKPFRARLQLCDDLAPLFYTGEPRDWLLSITKRCRHEIKDRNKLAHGHWHLTYVGNEKYKMMCKMRRHGTHIGKERPFTVAQVNRLTKTYGELSNEFIQFSKVHHPDGPLPERIKKFFRSLQNSQTI